MNRYQWCRVLAYFAVLAAPILGPWLLFWFMAYSIRDYVPFLNDEISYYLQAKAFVHHGWNAGYFGVAEQSAPCSFSHFGVHGPAFPVLYGVLGRVFGLPCWTACFFNAAMVSLGLAVYLLLARPTSWQCFGISLLILSFWPYHMYVATWMQESVHFALASALAGVFVAVAGRAAITESIWFRLGAVALVAAGSMLRISWALAYVPLFILFFRQRSWPVQALAVVAAGAVILAQAIAFRFLCAPYFADENAFFMNKLVAFSVGLESLWKHVADNLAGFRRVFQAEPLLCRFSVGQYLISLCFFLFVGFALIAEPWFPGTRKQLFPDREDRVGLYLCIYFLVATIVATVFAYTVAYFRGFRIFAIEMMLVLLILAVSPSRLFRGVFVAVVLSNLLVAPAAVFYLKDYYAPAFRREPAWAELEQKIESAIHFDPNADAWANTLLTDHMPSELCMLPTGIGVEIYFDDAIFNKPVKSRYVIATSDVAKRFRFPVRHLCGLDGLTGRLHTTFSPPALYENLDPVK
jgi:hypothetical protein